jgi:glutaminyl-peptide cyclotransferase
VVRLTPRRFAALAVLQVVLLAALLVHREHASAAANPARAVTPPTTVDRFDAERAMATVRMQLKAGQRPAGSPQLRAVAVKLKAMLPHARFEDVPGHPGLRNIIGSLPGAQPAIVLGAHYDTEYHPKGFVGANDAAAAVGAVIEIARDLQHLKRPKNAPAIDFVLFDGEEEPFPTNDFYLDALRGSKAYVDAHAAQTKAMVLLDYIGNRGVRLPREGSSDLALWTRVRAAARRVGATSTFPLDIQTTIIDDHTPFLQHGIPAVDLIDWSYPVKDTNKDTYDKLSPRAVDAVGETIVELLRTWR